MIQDVYDILIPGATLVVCAAGAAIIAGLFGQR